MAPLEREACYVQDCPENRKILLSVIRRMANPGDIEEIHPLVVDSVSQWKGADRCPPNMSRALLGVLLSIWVFGFPTAPEYKPPLVESSTPVCSIADVDNGDC